MILKYNMKWLVLAESMLMSPDPLWIPRCVVIVCLLVFNGGESQIPISYPIDSSLHCLLLWQGRLCSQLFVLQLPYIIMSSVQTSSSGHPVKSPPTPITVTSSDFNVFITLATIEISCLFLCFLVYCLPTCLSNKRAGPLPGLFTARPWNPEQCLVHSGHLMNK